MFIVQDKAVSSTILAFYANPDNIGWRDELTRLNLLDRVEPFANKVQALTLADFIENDRWLGINKEMDQYLPTIIHNRLVYDTNYSSLRGYDYDILRSVSLSAHEPIHNVTIRGNSDFIWFKDKTPGYTILTIDIDLGLPTCLLPYHDINITADIKPDKVQYISTFLPLHIYEELKKIKQVVFPSQGKDYYIFSGVMNTHKSKRWND